MKTGKSIIMNAILLMSVLATTIVYSAFSTQLQIQGEAVLRAESEIRITNVTLKDFSDGSIETFNNKYSKDQTSLYATISGDGSMTYEIEVTNKGNKGYDVKDIKLITNNNPNISVEIELKKNGLIRKNSVKIFTITLKNNTSSQQEGIVVHQYSFVEHVDYVQTYNTPQMHTFNVPYSGIYMIELWGAQGNNPSDLNTIGGLGAYTKGLIELIKGTNLYIYVGEHKVTDIEPSFNCGSTGGTHSDCYGGGGSTDIRTTSGNWNDVTSLRSRIMVAAGGGGASNDYYSDGGAAGGLIGYDGINNYRPGFLPNIPPTGGTQVSGGKSSNKASNGNPIYPGTIGSFGSGGNSQEGWGGGGGSGYYGGGGGGHSSNSVDSGAGGSSYISGHAGCIAITSASNSNPKKTTYQTISDSYHYSNNIFTDTVMIDGKGCKWTTSKTSDCSGQIQPDGTIEIGHSGNGYAKITLVE